MKRKRRSYGPWWRFYVSSSDDEKLGLLSDNHFRAWTRLNSIATERGGIIPNDMKLLTFRLRKTPGQVRETLQVLLSAVLLERIGDDYTPHNWEERQFDSDISTSRVREFRQRSKAAKTPPPETHVETEMKRFKVTKTAPIVTEIQKEETTTAGALTPALEGFVVVCETLGIVLDPRTVLGLQRQFVELREHFTLEEIEAATLQTKTQGRKVSSLNYLKPILDAARRVSSSTPIAPAVEPTDARGWERRMELYRETGTWLEKWGPKWGEPGCLCPPDAYVGELPKFLERKAAS